MEDLHRALTERVVEGARAAGVELPAGLRGRCAGGELRLWSGEGLVARAGPRARGGVFFDALAAPGGEALAERASAGLSGLEGELRRAAGPSPWGLPFDRGPGLYRLAEVDLGGACALAFGGVDARIVYLDGACLGDCTFCRSAEPLSDGGAEQLLLGALRAGALDLGGAYVCVGGPEPTLHPGLPALLRAMQEAGAGEIAMIATAERLADAGYGRELAGAGLGAVSLPVYGPGPEVHDAIVRKGGSFERLRAAIAGAREAGLRVFLHTLLLRENEASLGELGAWAAGQGLPLSAGLPRPKDPRVAGFLGLDPGVTLIGGPRCLFPATRDTGGAALLAERGPMALYLAVQAGEYAPACAGCGERAGCWGAPRGLTPALSRLARPRARGPG